MRGRYPEIDVTTSLDVHPVYRSLYGPAPVEAAPVAEKKPSRYKCRDCGWIGTESEMGADAAGCGDCWSNHICGGCGAWHIDLQSGYKKLKA